MKKILLDLPAWAVAATLLFTGCVDDNLNNTLHPDHGKITLATDWTQTNLTQAPSAGYTVAVGEYKATVTANPAAIDNLFNPGTYRSYVYTAGVGITVNGWDENTEIGVALMESIPDAAICTPDWFYSGTQEFTIEKDKEYNVTVSMKQQVRELALVIRPQGSAVPNITGITAELCGVAQAWNLHTDQVSGDAVKVIPSFVRQENGDYQAVMRLLGVCSGDQTLTGTISFDGYDDIAFSKPLHDVETFAGFNDAKHVPLGLEVYVVPVHDDPNIGLVLGDFAPIPE